MKAVIVPALGGLDRLKVVDLRDPGAPQAGEIRVRLHANSINFHAYAVARGFLPSADGRILLKNPASTSARSASSSDSPRQGDSSGTPP